jgi:hypothetical protein
MHEASAVGFDILFLGALLISAKCAAFNWWAASFRDNTNAPAYERRGNWCFAGTVLSLAGVIYCLWPRQYGTAAVSRDGAIPKRK